MTAQSLYEEPFEANQDFSIRRGSTHWEVSALHAAPEGNRFISFSIPFSLSDDGKEHTYSLTANSDADKAHARYFSQNYFVISTEGELKVRHIGPEEKVTGSFHFKANYLGQQFSLSDGKFELKGIDTRKKVARTVTAEISGAIKHKFSAETISFTHDKIKPEFSLRATDLLRNNNALRTQLTLTFSDSLAVGKYPISKDGNVRAVFHQIGSTTPIFSAIDGTLTLEETPVEGRLNASLKFNGQAISGEEIKVSNGFIDYQQ